MQGHMMQALGYTIFLRYLFGGIFALFLASVAMPSQPAQADFIDGRQLQLYCASQNPADKEFVLSISPVLSMPLPRLI
jgi:hypothetical protein